MLLADNKGKTIWAHWGYTHVDGGWVAKILPHSKGMQCFGYDIQEKKWSPGYAEYIEITPVLWGSEGNFIDNPPNSWVLSFSVDWDGDSVREICTSEAPRGRATGHLKIKS